MTIHELLKDLDACVPAQKWAKDYATIEEIISNCHRGDWIAWLAEEMKLDKRLLVLSGALCAKTVIHLMKDERSIKAVEVAELYGHGLATDDELAAAAAYAYAANAAAAYTAAAACAAAAASAAAACAASAADYTKNRQQTADIMRSTLGKELIEAVNLRLKS